MNATSPRSAARAALTLLAATTLAACGSSGGGSPSTGASSTSATSPTSTASSTAPSTPATSSSTAAAGGCAVTSSGPKADAATTKAVKKAYETVFDYRTPPAATAKYLQDGPAFASVAKGLSQIAKSQKITAKVTAVTLPCRNTARVVWTLSTNGNPTLANTSGYGVRENGSWKVAGQTFCALLALNNTKAPVCSDPKATTLPK